LIESDTQELIKLLWLADCYQLSNGKGDHAIWFSPINEHPFIVDNKIKSRHTANAVLKQVGLPKAFRGNC